MSNLVDIETLRKEFQEKTKVKDLKEFAQSQQTLLEHLMKENKVLSEKNKQLETILFSNTNYVSPEELICLEQIALLKKRSESRELSLEEAKKLDLFIKNLKIIKENSTISLNKDDYRDVKEDALVAIAKQETSE